MSQSQPETATRPQPGDRSPQCSQWNRTFRLASFVDQSRKNALSGVSIRRFSSEKPPKVFVKKSTFLNVPPTVKRPRNTALCEAPRDLERNVKLRKIFAGHGLEYLTKIR
jgi:hypothetical protein